MGTSEAAGETAYRSVVRVSVAWDTVQYYDPAQRQTGSHRAH